ncbi:MAG: YjbQ family protein [Acidobacteriota bacterium]|nr:YjbQ family protein [Acidobacteriota bacterium]
MSISATKTASSSPFELTLRLRPGSRVDVIDVTREVKAAVGDRLARHRRALYCSHHTTAGYLEQSLCSRLRHDPDALDRFIGAFRQLFPPEADYQHDRLELRHELSEEQRQTEPLNADSHLTYIGSGLNNCVTYVNRAEAPVFFIELDGVFKDRHRIRRTTVIGYDQEREVTKLSIDVPVSRHTIDSVNLRDPRLGIMEQIEHEIARHGIEAGRVVVTLDGAEHHAGLTVNEYETMLMQHDLVEVLRNPVRFMAEKGRHMLANPRAIPNKTLNYAKYDMVRIYNELLDVLGITETRLEKLLAELVTRPASRFLRMRHSVNFLVSTQGRGSQPAIVAGRYQSPILVQWQRSEKSARRLTVSLTRFD